MGAGAQNNNQASQLDMAQMTYFNNQVKRMKYANEKNGFKNKTKQTNKAINQVMLKLRKDKLLDTSQMNKWKSKQKRDKRLYIRSKSKQKQINVNVKQIAKNIDAQIRKNRVKTKTQKIEKIVKNQSIQGPDNNTNTNANANKKLYVGQIGKRYLNGDNKIKSQNKLLQYQSLNPNIQSYWNKSRVENIEDSLN